MTGNPIRMTVQRQTLGPSNAEGSEGQMSSDTLSDVLRAVRLKGALFFDVRATAPWVAEAPASRDVAPYVMPTSGHVIEYHLITSGSCFGGVAGEAYHKLDEGDLIIFPQGDSHVLASAPGMRTVPDLANFVHLAGARLPVIIQEHGGGAPTSMICGFLGCDDKPFNPLLKSLPRVLIMRSHQLAGRTLEPLIQLAVMESKQRRAGSECALSRVSELLFVEAIRAHVESLPPEQAGWLSGLRDPHIGKALAALHDHPAYPWSIEELSRNIGLSKSLLSERFTHFVGLPPMSYLAEWRIQLAAERLRTTNETLSEIAERVGYGSESALSRAFKRLLGVSPISLRPSRLPRSA